MIHIYSINQLQRIRGSAGEPLPTVYRSLENADTRFLRGSLALIAAAPGVGKSIMALNLVLRSKTPTLYFSADSDAFTQYSRSVACVSGCTFERATMMVRTDTVPEAVRDQLAKIPVRFVCDATPDLDSIEMHVAAYRELYGDFPDLTVIDNVTDVDIGNREENDLNDLMSYLHEMARKTESCVLGLHHVTGSYNDSNKPVPLSGLKDQIGRVPALILTMHKERTDYGPDILKVSTVKNRAGRADASGESFVELDFIGETMRIQDPGGE